VLQDHPPLKENQDCLFDDLQLIFAEMEKANIKNIPATIMGRSINDMGKSNNLDTFTLENCGHFIDDSPLGMVLFVR
jgi:hypothetical protein